MTEIRMDEVVELGEFEIEGRLGAGPAPDNGWVYLIKTSLRRLDDAERVIKEETARAVVWAEAIQNALPTGFSTVSAVTGRARPDVQACDRASQDRDDAFRQITYGLRRLGFEVVS